MEVGPEGGVAEVPGGVAGWVDRAVGRQARPNEQSSRVVPSRSTAATTDGADSLSAPGRPRVNPRGRPGFSATQKEKWLGCMTK